MYSQRIDREPSLGDVLQKARAERGSSLQEASRVTRIPRRYLEALEQGRYDILPAPVYARGFLRSYSSYLGLDTSKLMLSFQSIAAGEPEEVRPQPLSRKAAPPSLLLSKFAFPMGVLVMAGIALLAYVLAGNAGESSLSQVASTSSVASTELVSGSGDMLSNLVGQSAENAVASLELQGTGYIVISVQADGNTGEVVNQIPSADSILAPNGIVTLFVSR